MTSQNRLLLRQVAGAKFHGCFPIPHGYFASANADGRPEITVTGQSSTPGSLLTDDLVAGSGAVAEAGDLIEVNYVGALAADGMVFDASWDRSETFFVPIGTGALIPGWDQGLLGMAEGGRRLLVIPPDLAYGSAGAGGAADAARPPPLAPRRPVG